MTPGAVGPVRYDEDHYARSQTRARGPVRQTRREAENILPAFGCQVSIIAEVHHIIEGGGRVLRVYMLPRLTSSLFPFLGITSNSPRWLNILES
jgi:hypothetical protein